MLPEENSVAKPLTLPVNKIREWFCRFSLALYLLIVIAQSAYLFFTYDNYPYAGISGTDGSAYYAFIRSLWIDGDLDFQNEFYDYNYNKHGFQTPDFFKRSPHTGLIMNHFRIGFAIFLIPFFLIAHCLTIIGSSWNWWSFPADGYSFIYQLAPPVNTIFWGACAYWTTQRVLKRFFSQPVAAAATFVVFLSYPGSFTIIRFWCNPHLQAFLLFNLLLLLAFRVEDRRDGYWTWASMGCCVGLLALMRTECILVSILPFLLFCDRVLKLWKSPSENQELLGRALWKASAAPFFCILAFLPQWIVWRLMWGQWEGVYENMSDGAFNWTRPVLLKVLFSTRHGLFYWSPLLLIAFAGFLFFLRDRRVGIAVQSSAVSLLSLYYIYASWCIWWMGYSFGARQFITFTVIFCLGLAFLFERFAKWKRCLATISLGFIAWNMAMLWMFINGHIPRNYGFEPFLPLKKCLWLIGRALGVAD